MKKGIRPFGRMPWNTDLRDDDVYLSDYSWFRCDGDIGKNGRGVRADVGDDSDFSGLESVHAGDVLVGQVEIRYFGLLAQLKDRIEVVSVPVSVVSEVAMDQRCLLYTSPSPRDRG